MAKRHQVVGETGGWLLIGIGLFAFLYMIFKKKPASTTKLPAESVTSKIITAQGTITAQAGTGFPQFDVTVSSTIPTGYDDGQEPLWTNGVRSTKAQAGASPTAPVGFNIWHEVSADEYFAIPSAQTSAGGPALTAASTQCDKNGNCAAFDANGNFTGYIM
jgi:hypothetical protein